MDKSKSKLAVLYADICDSTRLYEQYGDAIARADMALCVEILSQAARGLEGEVIKTIGDEVMCAFEQPIKSALAATEMQASLKRACTDKKFEMGDLYIKIGWHFGAVDWRGKELVGEAPVTAQQIIGLAKAGEILSSRQSLDDIPLALFQGVQPIDTLEAQAWDGELEVVRIPWEQTGEETQVSEVPAQRTPADTAELVLEYKETLYRVNATQTHCRLGRGRHADLQVNGNFTSRQHAEISYRNGRFALRDESVNGMVIVSDDGNVKRLRREEEILTGNGVLGCGAPPDEDPDGAVRYECHRGSDESGD